jgi:hypothetical protein
VFTFSGHGKTLLGERRKAAKTFSPRIVSHLARTDKQIYQVDTNILAVASARTLPALLL